MSDQSLKERPAQDERRMADQGAGSPARSAAPGRTGGQDARQREQASIAPRVDVLEDEGGITLYADLPGVTREALEVKVEADTLIIEGAISAATPAGMEATYAEVRAPRYRRAFNLSRELDTERVDAELKDGVLKLRIPKVAEAQPRRIQVKVG